MDPDDACVGRVVAEGTAGAGGACVCWEEPLSNVEGSSGGGPSRAQRRDSYLERMKDSILLVA